MIKITCLIENLVYRGGLLAEHGLSFHIQTDTQSILFDTGQTGNFILNAQKLGVDIENIDSLVLSHGHYDHTGGLEAFCEINSQAKIYCKPQIFQQKFNGKKSIGFKQFTNIDHERFICIEETTQIDESIFINPDIPIYNSSDTNWTYFKTEKDFQIIPDTFEDELFVSIIHENKLSILSSCSHRGITNIVRKAIEDYSYPLYLVLGGFHIKDAQTDRTKILADFFTYNSPEIIATCHCTGIEQYNSLKNSLGEKVQYFHTGLMIEL